VAVVVGRRTPRRGVIKLESFLADSVFATAASDRLTQTCAVLKPLIFQSRRCLSAETDDPNRAHCMLSQRSLLAGPWSVICSRMVLYSLWRSLYRFHSIRYIRLSISKGRIERSNAFHVATADWSSVILAGYSRGVREPWKSCAACLRPSVRDAKCE